MSSLPISIRWRVSAAEDLQKDNVAAAEAKCLRALGIDREHENSLTVLGMVLQAQGRHDDAIRVFNSLTLKQPSSARHWENLGIAYRGARRYDAALFAFARVLALGPGSAVMLYNLGLVHAELLDLPSAHEVLSQARVLAPRDAWTCIAFARCSYDLGDFEERQTCARGVAGTREPHARSARRDRLPADPHGSGLSGAACDRIACIASAPGTRGAHASECARAI